jgi:hypothetical protein
MDSITRESVKIFHKLLFLFLCLSDQLNTLRHSVNMSGFDSYKVRIRTLYYRDCHYYYPVITNKST